ncbi:MAG: carbohydrate porin [Planctomycetes bacterium]|nr:carbohydrate porin [Planctomycetota bacterium]
MCAGAVKYALVAVLLLFSSVSGAAEPPATAAAPADPPPAPQPAGSSDDVNAELDAARPRPAGLLPWGPVSILDPLIDDLNAELDRLLGLQIGLTYTAVYQRASDGDAKDAAGGDLDLIARWRLFGEKDSGYRGILGANGEYRHDFGEIPPRELADTYGSLWRTVNGFGLQDPAVVQYWWEQHLFDDALVVTLGKLDADNYYNTNRYQSDSTAFLSRMFSSNIARNHPGNGLGFNFRVKLGTAFYVTAGAQDANGDKERSGFGTIDDHEFFSAVEGGWTPTFEGLGKGAHRLTLWHSDSRDDAMAPSDKGVGLSCEQEIGGGVVPFLRAAWAEGDVTGVERFVGGGIGLEGLLRAKEDLTGIGIGWGDPADHLYHGQWGIEVFHRFQLTPDIQFTMGYQYICDPVKAGGGHHDPVGVFSLRVRIAF